jgi:hypothetical protein
VTITREQVADLRPGDVVEYSGHPDFRGAKIVGPLVAEHDALLVGEYVVRRGDGGPPGYRNGDLTLTVVSRAPRPLYVNHDRAEPVPGDVVRDADDDSSTRVWACHAEPVKYLLPWILLAGLSHEVETDELPVRLRLLVDGTTGRCVP